MQLSFPIKIKIYPAATQRQTLSLQYDFDLNVVPIDVNISDVLVSSSYEFLNSILSNYIDEERELKTLLNYGNDTQTVALAYRYGPRDINNVNTIQLKLLKPVPEEIQENTSVFLSREVVNTIVDKIRVRFAPPINNSLYLRPKNLSAPTNISLGKAVNHLTLKVLSLQTGSVSAEDQYNNKTFEDEIFRKWYSYDFNSAELNLDFTDYRNFVFYGSAAMRLTAFREKLKLLEQTEYNRKQFLSSSFGAAISSSATAIFVQNKSAEYAKEKENIIRAFDRYEQYLYFTSGTIAPYSASAWYADGGVEFNSSSYWPRSGSQLAPVYSDIAEEWYTSQLEIAQRFDEFNENNLVNTIPTHIREDDENSPYITFVSMIGHFFDILKPYVDQYPYIYDRGLDPNTGLSKDLINEIAEAVGFTMPTVNSIYNLSDNILGTTEEEPRRDITSEIYKRLLHNLPFFVKSKGSRQSLETLIRVLGFNNQLISIKETGVPTSGSVYVFDEYTTGLYFNASVINNTSLLLSENGNSITTEAGDEIGLEQSGEFPYIKIPLLHNPKTLQLNLALDTTSSTVIFNSNDGWEMSAIPHPSIPKFGKIVLLDSSSNVIINTGYQEIFNNELFNLAFRSSPAETSLRLIKTEGDDTLINLFVTESVSFNSVWQNTEYLYIGGAGSYFASSSFTGTIDEFRLWSNLLSDETMINTAFDPGSNAGDTYTAATDSLLIQLSFNNINTSLLATSSLLMNEAPSSSADLLYISASNVSTDSIARFNRTVRQLIPTLGTMSYISNKIKIINPPAEFADKNGTKRLYRNKSIFSYKDKRVVRGRNKLVLANSPVDIINQNIIRNLGLENINTALGVPTTLYKNFERSLKALKRHYLKYHYIEVDANQYIRVLSEISSVLDQVVDYFIPSRASLIKGIFIEQSILEQTRIPRIRDIRLYGKNSRRTLRAVGSLTGSNADYSATYTVTSANINSTPQVIGKYDEINAEIKPEIISTGNVSAITASIKMNADDFMVGSSVSQITSSIFGLDLSKTIIASSEYKTITSSIDTELYKMNKVPYNANNYGSPGAEPFDRIYPRKLFGTEIEKPRYGGSASVYLPALYDVPPIADFRDIGVTTYFNNPEGVYTFPVIKKKLAYIRPLNQLWNYESQQFEGITTWSYGSTYNIYDVVVQDVSIHDSASLSLETIAAARAGNKVYYAFKTRPSYSPPLDGTSYYSGSVPSFLPPSLDQANWEQIRFTPVLEYVPKRIVFDTFTVPDPLLTNYKLTIVDIDSVIDFPNRFVDSYNVDSISANGFVIGQFLIQNIANLLAIQANATGIRVRLYRNIESRNADIYRPIGTPPSIDDGLLIDVQIDQFSTAQIIDPIVTLLSDTRGIIYYTVNNLMPFDKTSFVLSLYYFAIQIQRRVPYKYLRKHYKFFRDNTTALKRRNYLGCKNTVNTTIDGQPPIQIFYGEGSGLVVAATQTNNQIVTGGGGQLNVT